MILPFWLRQLLGSPLTRCNLGYPHLPEIGKRASCELLHRTVLANLKASLWPVWKLLTESSQTKTGPLQTWLNPNMQMNANQHNPPAKVHLNSSKAKCFFLMPRILNFPCLFLVFFSSPSLCVSLRSFGPVDEGNSRIASFCPFSVSRFLLLLLSQMYPA